MKLSIGLFGFGTVGESLYNVLQQTPSFNGQVRKVCIRHPEKKRTAPPQLFTTDAGEILGDPNINTVVELIDDAGAAYLIITQALRAGKNVVSANKAVIAAHFQELIALQQETGASLLYEAAACASIPVIRNLEEYYDNDLLQGIEGIVNGSTNYILTRVGEDGVGFDEALIQAQLSGFAETDPTLDINGADAAAKLCILLQHAYGITSGVDEILYNGIQQLHSADAERAAEKGQRIRLVATARKLSDGRVAAFVLPQYVKPDSQLYNVRNEYNGVFIRSSLADGQFFYGKGAGGVATASAVLSDLSALRYGYRYEYRKRAASATPALSDDYYLRVHVSFNGLFHVPHELFERIDEWRSNDERCSVTGIVHVSKLRQSNWWRRGGTSLVLLPDAVIDPNAMQGIRQASPARSSALQD